MLSGVESPLGMLRAKSVEILGELEPQVRVRVVLVEGKNRHIRRMFAGLRDWKTNESIKVVELKRTHLGSLSLDVEPGSWRYLGRRGNRRPFEVHSAEEETLTSPGFPNSLDSIMHKILS